MVGFTGNRVGGGSKNPIADIDVPVANRLESAIGLNRSRGSGCHF